MRISRFSLGLLALLAVTNGPAHADDDDSWGWHMWGWQRGSDMPMMGRGMMMGGRFAVIDSNDDGVIGADEAASQRELVFAAMDGDDDGELTEAEFLNVSMGPGWNQDRKEALQAQKMERFAAMDPDKNGKVTQAEFMAEQQKRFASADSDKDGKVTPWEFRAMRWQ